MWLPIDNRRKTSFSTKHLGSISLLNSDSDHGLYLLAEMIPENAFTLLVPYLVRVFNALDQETAALSESTS